MYWNYLFLLFLIIELESIYFNYQLSLKSNTLNQENEKLWIHPLFGLMNHIVSAVYLLVMEYFITFRYCWAVILNALIILIYGYYHLLELLFEKILDYPTIIYSIIGMFLALYQCNIIIKNILNSSNKSKDTNIDASKDTSNLNVKN